MTFSILGNGNWRRDKHAELKMPISISLAVNDDNGNHTGRVSRVTFEVEGDITPYLDLWGDYVDNSHNVVCKLTQDGTHIKFGRKQFPIMAYSTHVGSIVFDCAVVSEKVAAQIANHLRGKVECEAAVTGLWNKWFDNVKFVADDFRL